MNFILMLLAVVGLTLVRGVVLQQLWSWYIVSFFNIQPLTIPMALGFVLVFGLFRDGYFEEQDREDYLVKLCTNSFSHSIAALFLGWIYYQFM